VNPRSSSSSKPGAQVSRCRSSPRELIYTPNLFSISFFSRRDFWARRGNKMNVQFRYKLDIVSSAVQSLEISLSHSKWWSK